MFICSLIGKHGQFVYLQLLGGRAFIDYINEPQTPPTTRFIFHVYHGNQHFVSAPVISSCDPDIEEGFLLQINDAPRVFLQDLLSISDPVHIIMTAISQRGGTELLGTCEIDWRNALCYHDNAVAQSVELSGLRAEARVPPGVLNIRWELMPKQDGCLKREVLEAQVDIERQRGTESKRMFLLYAKQWWREYLGIRENHAQRIVKIFAENETGESQVVCAYVSPLRAGRLLESPRHAARFVSLLEHCQPRTLGGTGGKGGAGEVWLRLHGLLATRSGVS